MPGRRRVKKAPYFRMFVGYWQDSRVLSLSLDAETVWVRSIAYSKAEHLDGLLPGYALLLLFSKVSAPPSVVTDELVDAGLWTAAADGWEIERWCDYQTTAAEDAEERENTRIRKDRSRHPERYANTNGDTGEEHDEPSRHDDAAEPPPGDVGSAPA